jgi:hypothetical protein
VPSVAQRTPLTTQDKGLQRRKDTRWLLELFGIQSVLKGDVTKAQPGASMEPHSQSLTGVLCVRIASFVLVAPNRTRIHRAKIELTVIEHDQRMRFRWHRDRCSLWCFLSLVCGGCCPCPFRALSLRLWRPVRRFGGFTKSVCSFTKSVCSFTKSVCNTETLGRFVARLLWWLCPVLFN